jgi:hypothetical protein
LNVATWQAGIKVLRGKLGLIIVVTLVTTIVLDTILLRTYDLYSKGASSNWTIPIFVSLISISILAQFSLLHDLRKNKVKIRRKVGTSFTRIHVVVSIVQFVLALNLIISIISIVTQSSYTTMNLMVGTTISYATTISLLLLLAIRFLRWFRSRRNIELLLYGISAASILISAMLTLLFSDLTLSHLPQNVRFRVGGTSIYIPSGSIEEKLAGINYLFVPLSFLITWLSTATLLRGYSKKHGNLRYWIVISIPLLVFMSQYIIQTFRISDLLMVTDPVFFGSLFTLLFIFTKLAGGILFGMAFWIISRRIQNGKTVRQYLVISAYGFLLLLLSIQILGIIVVPYPPFGILTISIAGMASYLVFVGIYGSAVTMTENSKLRIEIRKAVTESKFLESISSAQLENEIEKEVVAVSKNFQDKLLKETGMHLDMDEGDVKVYVQEVLNEIKKK